MSNLPSRKKYRDFCSKNHITEDLKREFNKYRYELSIYFDLSDSNLSYTHLRINTGLNGKKYCVKRAIIINRELSREKFSNIVNLIPAGISYSRDMKHLGELIFLLAAKLKYDLLSGKNKDNAGFLHTGDFERLNPLGNQAGHIKKTPLGKSVYRTLSKFKPSVKNHQSNHVNSEQHSFLLSFFDEPVQLFHLICYLGGIKKNTESYFWWLNISPENIRFMDVNTNKEVSQQILKRKLQNLFKGNLLEDKSLSRYVESIEDFYIGENKIKRLPPIAPFATRLKYFRDMRDVLKWNDEQASPRWLRKSGTIAADFRAGYIYERKELLKKVNKLATKTKVSLIKGDGGTGKSVLIRNYAYDIFRKDETQSIYHYSFKTDSQIPDVHEFLSILNSLSGLVIIEDIHLATQDVQFIVDGFSVQGNCSLLLTSRTSIAETLISHYSTTLESLPGITLTGSETVDEIIDLYIKNNTESKVLWTKDIKKAILKVSKGNLWLLSYALKGCTGEGEPISWIKEGVMQDLQDLENHKLHKCNPEILLALSPLYINEVLTAQTFLIKNLGYNRKDIDKLVTLGEVIRHEVNGDIFYGLPHTSLALAYLEHGNKYRDVLKYIDHEEFVYNYSISGATNSLEAILDKNDMEFTLRLFNKLANENRALDVLRKSKNIDYYKLVCFFNDAKKLSEFYSSHEYFSCLVDVLFKNNLFLEMTLLLRNNAKISAKEFWGFIDKEHLKQLAYNHSKEFSGACDFLSNLCKQDKYLKEEIAAMINNLDMDLIAKINGTLYKAEKLMRSFFKIDKNIALEFWRKLDKQVFMDSIYKPDDLELLYYKLSRNFDQEKVFHELRIVPIHVIETNSREIKKYCYHSLMPELFKLIYHLLKHQRHPLCEGSFVDTSKQTMFEEDNVLVTYYCFEKISNYDIEIKKIFATSS